MNYPHKPSSQQATNNSSKSITSIILFLVISYYYFDKNISLIVTVFLILLIHELGHLLAMKLFDYRDLKIFFIPLIGAYATGSKTNISQRQNILIYLAGPLPGILIAIGLYYYGLNYQNNYIYHASYYMLIINLFNLLPIKPLDGGNIISTLFLKSNKALELIFMILSVMAIIIVTLYLKSYILLIIPFFIILGQIRQLKVERIKKLLIKNGVSLEINYAELTDQDYWLIRTEVVKSFSFSPKIDPDLLQLSDQENKVIKYVKLFTREKVISKDLSQSFRELILFIIAICYFASFYYIRAIKTTPIDINSTKTFYEQITPDEIVEMKSQCISSSGAKMGLKLNDENKVAICNCYVDAILHKFTKADFDDLYKLDKKSRHDSLKKILSSCVIYSNDSINVDSILRN